MDSMHHLNPIAHQLMKTPISPGRKTTGCPTFEWRDAIHQVSPAPQSHMTLILLGLADSEALLASCGASRIM
jgi:hypothetical protein